MPTPALHTVQLALPVSLRAISHVEQLVSDLLIPSTIDAAVYLELRGVLSRYSDVIAVTVGAMDGAATRGKLAICRRLHTSRTEGCSPAAFIGAAANGHVAVLQWLYRQYPAFERTEDQIVAAAGNGYSQVVEFLQAGFDFGEIEVALEAAAANGHVNVMVILLPRVFNMRKALVAAAANRQVEAIQYLIERYNGQRLVGVYSALEAAVQNDHVEVMEMLVGLCDHSAQSIALQAAVQKGNLNMVTRMVEVGKVDMLAISLALTKAAKYDHYALVDYFLGQFPRFNVSPSGCKLESIMDSPLIGKFFALLLGAVRSGRMNLVQLFLNWSDCEAPHAFRVAASSRQWEVAKMVLRSYASKRWLSRFDVVAASTSAAEYAATKGDVEMAKLLVGKLHAFETGRALEIAGESGHLEIVKIFIDLSGAFSKINALVSAASRDRVEMVKYLLDECDQDTINRAFTRVASAGNLEVSRLLLERCSHGIYSGIFKHASENNLVHMVRLLLEDTSECAINSGIIIAAAKGNTEVVKLLLDKCDALSTTYALEEAAMEGRLAVVRLLRDRCDSESIRAAVARARAVGCDDVVQLLGRKRARLA